MTFTKKDKKTVPMERVLILLNKTFIHLRRYRKCYSTQSCFFFEGLFNPCWFDSRVLITRWLMTGDVVFLLLSGLKGLNGFTHEEQTAL